MRKLNKKGFTLTEMIVVIAIIGILAGVLIPTITGYIKRANKSNDQQLAASMTDEIERYCIENNLEQSNLIGTDIRTILLSKGYNLEPSRDDWTYVYNVETKTVELKDVKKGVLAWSVVNAVDPTNYAENKYLIGEGKNDFEQAVKLLVNYKSSEDYTTALSLVEDNSTYKSLVESFNPANTVYVNNVKCLSTPSGANKIVFTVGTYNLPNLTNANITTDGTTFKIPQIIESVDDFTKSKLSYMFENIDEVKINTSFATINLDDLELSNNSTPSFTFGPLVEESTEQSISIDIVGYTLKWTDSDEDGLIDPSEKEIKLVYQVTVIYYNLDGIFAKGTKLIESQVISSDYAANIELMYSKIVL
ncbi:MAG: type II secretion system protein [Bacilli bacterium]|nr:type II secretion system protein [Bacilli bacterium]